MANTLCSPTDTFSSPGAIPPGREIFCNRTLNLRSIKAVGFDMDYTLIHYHVAKWEARVYAHMQARLLEIGWPVGELRFDAELFAQGLVLDVDLGNVVKCNRFGQITHASHGTQMLDFDLCRRCYRQDRVDLRLPRWVFLNTLFALSEACIFAQCVDLLDEGRLPVRGYHDLYAAVRDALDETHVEGTLKAEIVADPATFVDVDPLLPQTLLDLQAAGKKLLLITNSEWSYTQAMMRYAFDPLLPKGTTWRDLFELTIVQASKPRFFTAKQPVFAIDPAHEDTGLLRPHGGPLLPSGVYLGGHVGLVEEFLGSGHEEVLYVGDHIFSDIHVSKSRVRWRTALVLRDLEGELAAQQEFTAQEATLQQWMQHKEKLEHTFSMLRLTLQRLQKPQSVVEADTSVQDPKTQIEAIKTQIQTLRQELIALDHKIAPLAQTSATLAHPRWGLLMRAGNDKSHLARQVERYADIYMSRVSNLLHATPFVYLRSRRGSMPHDAAPQATDPSLANHVPQGQRAG